MSTVISPNTLATLEDQVRVIVVGSQGLQGVKGDTGAVDAHQLPIGTLIATPSVLPAGGGFIAVAWTSQFATSAILNGDAVSIAGGGGGGGQYIPVSTTTTYTLILTNAYGDTFYKIVVTVLP